MSKPNAGQCDYQLPYSQLKQLDDYYLFNLRLDYHESHDQKEAMPALHVYSFLVSVRLPSAAVFVLAQSLPFLGSLFPVVSI
jgi:hypothetical protein